MSEAQVNRLFALRAGICVAMLGCVLLAGRSLLALPRPPSIAGAWRDGEGRDYIFQEFEDGPGHWVISGPSGAPLLGVWKLRGSDVWLKVEGEETWRATEAREQDGALYMTFRGFRRRLVRIEQ